MSSKYLNYDNLTYKNFFYIPKANVKTYKVPDKNHYRKFIQNFVVNKTLSDKQQVLIGHNFSLFTNI